MLRLILFILIAVATNADGDGLIGAGAIDLRVAPEAPQLFSSP